MILGAFGDVPVVRTVGSAAQGTGKGNCSATGVGGREATPPSAATGSESLETSATGLG